MPFQSYGVLGFLRSLLAERAGEEDFGELARQLFGVELAFRFVPLINPVDHP